MEYITAGESHGKQLTAIVTNIPAGISVSETGILSDLTRRSGGYGRSVRQQLESDAFEVTGGIRFGKTTGAPISIVVPNAEGQKYEAMLSAFGEVPEGYLRDVNPRPGHADLVGALKMNTDDCLDISERASARETVARVAAASIAREFLAELDVEIISYVTGIGNVFLDEDAGSIMMPPEPLDIETSEVRCPDDETSERMIAAIDAARDEGETLGGTFRIVATGLVPGIGEYMIPSHRLTSELGAALFSIPAIKGVEFGSGFSGAALVGSENLDVITIDASKGFSRETNHAGGLEGGMSTGQPLVITCAMKPLPTLGTPLSSVNMDTLEVEDAGTQRSDVCAVPAAAVVAEAEVAFVLARAYMKKFGSDNMADIRASFEAYKKRLRTLSR